MKRGIVAVFLLVFWSVVCERVSAARAGAASRRRSRGPAAAGIPRPSEGAAGCTRPRQGDLRCELRFLSRLRCRRRRGWPEPVAVRRRPGRPVRRVDCAHRSWRATGQRDAAHRTFPISQISDIAIMVAQSEGREPHPPRRPISISSEGDAKAAGEAYFQKTMCASCHSVTGDLKGFASKIPNPRSAAADLDVAGRRRRPRPGRPSATRCSCLDCKVPPVKQ